MRLPCHCHADAIAIAFPRHFHDVAMPLPGTWKEGFVGDLGLVAVSPPGQVAQKSTKQVSAQVGVDTVRVGRRVSWESGEWKGL